MQQFVFKKGYDTLYYLKYTIYVQDPYIKVV